MDYMDLAIRVGPRADGNCYTVHARSDAIGETTGLFCPPVTDDQLELFVLKVGLTRRGVRQIHSPEWRAAQEFGQKLFSALFADRLLSGLIASHNEAIRQGKGLRLTLSLDAPELANYPWEFLYDRDAGQFLSLFEDTPVVRYVELMRPVKPLAVAPPLRILAVASSPKDFYPLDIAREQRNLSEALKDEIDAGLVVIDWLPVASIDGLRAQLLKNPYHIFHFIGHGGFDEAQQDGVLLFENDQGGSRVVSGERLAVLLGNHRTLRLAVLNACEGARTSKQDPFAGTAMTLMRTGNLPAVVAMQFEITDQAAIDFSRGFYGALAAGRPVDAAVGQGRQAVFADDNDTEWSTPVLYLRAVDGQIFNLDRQATAVDKERQARVLRQQEEESRAAKEKATAQAAASLGPDRAESVGRDEPAGQQSSGGMTARQEPAPTPPPAEEEPQRGAVTIEAALPEPKEGRAAINTVATEKQQGETAATKPAPANRPSPPVRVTREQPSPTATPQVHIPDSQAVFRIALLDALLVAGWGAVWLFLGQVDQSLTDPTVKAFGGLIEGGLLAAAVALARPRSNRILLVLLPLVWALAVLLTDLSSNDPGGLITIALVGSLLTGGALYLYDRSIEISRIAIIVIAWICAWIVAVPILRTIYDSLASIGDSFEVRSKDFLVMAVLSAIVALLAGLGTLLLLYREKEK